MFTYQLLDRRNTVPKPLALVPGLIFLLSPLTTTEASTDHHWEPQICQTLFLFCHDGIALFVENRRSLLFHG